MYISIKLLAYYYQGDFFVRIQEGAITLTQQSQTHVKKGLLSVRMAETIYLYSKNQWVV